MAEYSSSLELKPKGFDQLERRMKGVQSNISGINARLRNTQGQFTKTGKVGTKSLDKLNRSTKVLSKSMFGLKTAVAGLLTGAGLVQLTSVISRNASSFEILRAQLKTVTGDTKKAEKAFSRLYKFSKRTPFDFKQSVKGFVKLKALGLVDTLEEAEAAMESYGNTSAAMGKSLEQMVEAVADASTMEFER